MQVRLFTKAQAAKRLCKPLRRSRVISKLAWECQNKVMLLWVHGHSGILEYKYADDLSREAFSIPLLTPKPAISISPCVGGLEVKE
jgi:ribonuclease HI